MNIPTTAPINYSNSTIFYPDNTGILGSFTRTPDSKTMVTLDYTSIMPAGYGLNTIAYMLNYGSAPQLVISGSQIQTNGNVLSFIVSGGVNGLKYSLTVNASLTDNVTLFTHELEIVVSAPFADDDCGCPPMSVSRSLSAGFPVVPSVFQQAQILNGDGTRFASTFVVYWVGASAPTTANILDRWFNTSDGLIYDRVTDGNSVFWVATAQRPQQYATSPTPPPNPYLGDYWFDTITETLNIYMNTGAGPTWAAIAVSGFGAFPLTVNVQVFPANGTYNPSPGLVAAMAECYGSGGGGGWVTGDMDGVTMYPTAAGGGGSGGYSRKYLKTTDVAGGVPVTIGVGGIVSAGVIGGGNTATATSFGTLCIANGGGDAQAYDGMGTISGAHGMPGAGAAPGIGDVALPGATGGMWSTANINLQSQHLVAAVPGLGGQLFGGAQWPVPPWLFTNIGGVNGAANSGAGGGGAQVNTGSGTVTMFGGAGGSGLVIVTEYCFG